LSNKQAKGGKDLSGKDAYLENMIKTASPAKLVELLYQRAIELTEEAIELLDKKDYRSVNERAKKAEDIIMELNMSLDTEKGGEIAKNLRALYNYMFQRLLDGNVKKDKEAFKEVKGMLKELLETWREVMKKAGNTLEISRDTHRSGLDINI